MNDQKDETPGKQPTLWQIICSVCAAAFGVQSNKNRQRDFSHGKPTTFIIAGIIFTLVFILVVVALVQLVLSQAG